MIQCKKQTLAGQLIQLTLTAAFAVALTASLGSTADAAGGSWGGSGGFGSGGGSWGASTGSTGSGGGLFGGRRPIRNFLGRVASRLSSGSAGSTGSGGGLFGGSRGGSFGGSQGGSQGGSHGGSGGSWGGSSGSSYASASYGSWGSAAAGPSLASFSSSPSYSLASAIPSYNSSYLGGYASMGYVDTASFASPSIAGCASCASSSVGFPINQGISTGIVETGYSVDTGFHDGAMPNYEVGVPTDGAPLGGMPIDGMPIDGGYDPGSAAPTDYYDSGSSLLDDGTSPSPPLPGPSGDDSASQSHKSRSLQAKSQQKSAAILSVSLPADAEVYINGKRTKTEGAIRNYVSRRLKEGQQYPYRVKAVVHRNGKQLVRTQTVSMTPGVIRTVQMDFDRPVTTTLAVKVPKDATVRLCGADTLAKGERRFFETSKLVDGETWKDYEIEVTVQRDGKNVVVRRSLTLNAGDIHEVSFDFNDQTGQLVASM